MAVETTSGPEPRPDAESRDHRPLRRTGFRLLRRLLVYHLSLVAALVLLILLIPSVVDVLPVGGVETLAQGGDVQVSNAESEQGASREIVTTVLRATGALDSLGYARRLTVALLGTLLLMLPVSWVHKSIYRASTYDHSLDETTLILPGVVAAIVLVVQHSLALAFSLAGIVAGVQFRRALQDTFDTLFILVAIGVGIAAGVEALEIAAVLTVFFSYATLYVCCFGDGLESDFVARRKAEKRRRRQAEAAAAERATTGDEAPGQ
ncbi:MAG: hypothetical protein RQ847_01510 [Wenzhouxiangellaceae bacterium]|nr:hypothetical protein [Wenzhouxiangellaceae bacterium]